MHGGKRQKILSALRFGNLPPNRLEQADIQAYSNINVVKMQLGETLLTCLKEKLENNSKLAIVSTKISLNFYNNLNKQLSEKINNFENEKRGEKKSSPPKKQKLNFKTCKKNTINSLNEVEHFLRNFNNFTT